MSDKRQFTEAELEVYDLKNIETQPWRHGTRQTYVFEADGKHWMFTTEVHHDDGIQLDDSVECVEVHKVERTVTVWEPVP